MNPQARRFEWFVWGGVILTLILLLLGYYLAQLKLSQYGKPLPVIGPVQDFTLTNQNGKVVRLQDLKGKVWVADIIFTRCAGPCPEMTRQMRLLQQALPKSSSAQLVTLTTDPDFDTPAVLKRYAERFGANESNWHFLTGSKPEIKKLAVDSLKLVAIEKDEAARENPQDLFIHSTIFVVVDKQGRLRGVYETTGEGVNPQRVRQTIVAAVRRLEREK